MQANASLQGQRTLGWTAKPCPVKKISLQVKTLGTGTSEVTSAKYPCLVEMQEDRSFAISVIYELRCFDGDAL